jgi:hypothetical protein
MHVPLARSPAASASRSLVLDRYDLLQDAWGSMLEAALRVQRQGWLDEA